MQIRAEQGREEYLRQRKEMQFWQDIQIGQPMKVPSHESVEHARKAWGIGGQTSWEQLTSKGQNQLCLYLQRGRTGGTIIYQVN